jgi:hypothetical protein
MLLVTFGGITGAKQQAEAAGQAAATQAAASAAGIAEQQRQFNKMVELMSPYVTAGANALPGLDPYAKAGAPALAQQRALAGLDGPEAQQAAIRMIEASPEMAAYTQQGENAILQNASATGGLRGGNTQGALAQFRPELLAQLIDRQYSRLGGLTALGQGTTQNLTTLGQASAAGQAAQGLQSGANIANLLGQQGAATAGGQLAQGSVVGNTFGTLANLGGAFVGAGGFPGISKAFSF